MRYAGSSPLTGIKELSPLHWQHGGLQHLDLEVPKTGSFEIIASGASLVTPVVDSVLSLPGMG